MSEINKMFKLISLIVNFSLLIYLMQQPKSVQMNHMIETSLDVTKMQHDVHFLNRKLNELNKKYEIIFKSLNKETEIIMNFINKQSKVSQDN